MVSWFYHHITATWECLLVNMLSLWKSCLTNCTRAERTPQRNDERKEREEKWILKDWEREHTWQCSLQRGEHVHTHTHTTFIGPQGSNRRKETKDIKPYTHTHTLNHTDERPVSTELVPPAVPISVSSVDIAQFPPRRLSSVLFSTRICWIFFTDPFTCISHQ